MRRMAKAVNFGIIYGISGYGLSENIGVSPKEATQFINNYIQVLKHIWMKLLNKHTVMVL